MRYDSGYANRQAWHVRSASSYAVRLLTSLCVVLAMFVVVAHVPTAPPIQRVGWDVPPSEFPISVARLQQLLGSSYSRVPQTRFPDEGAPKPEEEPSIETIWEGNTEPVQTIEPVPTLAPIFDFAEDPPSIRGGMGAYYIHIEYPQDAIESEIQGSLLLEFVVEPDGQASDITVVKPLHPSCDSAAVRALQRTYFVPGRQNGEEVRVRMSLPVRFVLLPAEPAAATAQSPDSLSASR